MGEPPKPANDNDLTTLEKDLDHSSPLKNPTRGYSADAPLSAAQKPT